MVHLSQDGQITRQPGCPQFYYPNQKQCEQQTEWTHSNAKWGSSLVVGVGPFWNSSQLKFSSLLWFCVQDNREHNTNQYVGRLFRVNGLWYTHTQSVVKRKKWQQNNYLFRVIPKTMLQTNRKRNSKICSLHHNKFTLSTEAQSDRQLVCCVFSFILHISLWHDIISDDCLSVMVYDEKFSGLLMWDVSVYHFDGWPPW